MEFKAVEENLRESFRVLAAGRTGADVTEMEGLSIASLGVAFQMFNAAFLSSAVATQEEMEARLTLAREHFEARGIEWSFWICEDWVARPVLRKISRICHGFGLRLASEMPGMVAVTLKPAEKATSEIEVRRVNSEAILHDFQAIGSTCFHVPFAWFAEVFDMPHAAESPFACFVGYREGVPVTTAAAVVSPGGTLGFYNIATVPEKRGRGYGEAITRHAAEAGLRAGGNRRLVLQSTWQGLSLYERLGFRTVARFSVYNSSRSVYRFPRSLPL